MSWPGCRALAGWSAGVAPKRLSQTAEACQAAPARRATRRGVAKQPGTQARWERMQVGVSKLLTCHASGQEGTPGSVNHCRIFHTTGPCSAAACASSSCHGAIMRLDMTNSTSCCRLATASCCQLSAQAAAASSGMVHAQSGAQHSSLHTCANRRKRAPWGCFASSHSTCLGCGHVAGSHCVSCSSALREK